jgi:4-aminobutyrate aminotransferase
MGALSLTGSKSVQKRGFAPLLGGVTHIPYAYCYRCAYGKQVESCKVECVKILEDQLFKTIVPADEVAAIFVEPVQGEGGYLVPPKKFLDELAEVAQRHGILLVCDEVQSGMGRTGKMFAYQHFGVDPDIVTLAKGIASGLPLSATVAKAQYMQWTPGSHASTFGGNPVSVEAALATIALLEEGLIDNAARLGAYMLERMRSWPARFRVVGDVRGLGLMLGVEIVRDQAGKEKDVETRNRLVEMAFRRGMLVLGAGQNSIRLAPPLVLTRDQADFGLELIEECLAEVCK